MPPFEYGLPDEDALNEELARQQKAAQRDYDAFYLAPGITKFRILPPYPGSRVWIREIMKHSLVVDGTRHTKICPRMFDADNFCPICDRADTLRAEGGEANTEAAKNIRATRKSVVNAVILTAPGGREFDSSKVYVLELPVRTAKAILLMNKDVAMGNADVTGAHAAARGEGLRGLTFAVTRSGQGINTEYSLQVAQGRTDLAEDLGAKGIDINDLELYDLDNVFKADSEEELAALVAKMTMPAVRPKYQAPAPKPVQVRTMSTNKPPQFEVAAPPKEE